MSDFYRKSPHEQAVAMQSLAEAAAPLWHLPGARISLVKLRENAVFRIDGEHGRRCIMRIHRYRYHTDEELLSELHWVRALGESGIAVPPVVPAASGRLFEIAGVKAVPEPRQVDVLDWLDGLPMGAIGESLEGNAETMSDNFRALGRLAARVHNQATAWTPPPGFQRHHWDADGITGDAPFWGRFWDLDFLTESQRRLFARVRTAVRKDLLACGKPPATYSMIHADLVPENVLVGGEHLKLLDFDDAGYGWHQFEIATALIFHFGRDYFDTIRDALIAGYRGQRALPDEALDTLPLFFLARSLTYLGWLSTRYETEFAKELAPWIIDTACALADDYLSGQSRVWPGS